MQSITSRQEMKHQKQITWIGVSPQATCHKSFESRVWMSNKIRKTNIDAMEKEMAAYRDCKHAVGLSCGTSTLYLATKLAGEKLCGHARPNQGTLQGHRVMLVFDRSVFGTRVAPKN